MALRSVCVFCASAAGARPAYREAAVATGQALAARGLGLVYGGATVGLMGAVAGAALQAGGTVVGVVPEVLVKAEVAHPGCTELLVVDTMHTRKATMAERADGFLVLPGGFGTLEELFEVLTWQVLRIHSKPVCLLNIDGFYDGLLQFLDTCVVEGVLRETARAAVLVATTVDEALDRMEAWADVV